MRKVFALALACLWACLLALAKLWRDAIDKGLLLRRAGPLERQRREQYLR